MTASRPDTWMPMYWGDYLRDTGHLTTEQHGAYLLLIGHYWTTGKPLPDDDGRLARIARLSLATWKKSRAVVAEFFAVADSKWTHGRIEKEIRDAADFVEKQRLNGQKGGRPKKPTDNPPAKPAETTLPLPSPSPSLPENPAQLPSLDAARAREVRQRVEEILNSPTVTMFNRVDAWLLAGAIPETDIYPTLEAGMKKLSSPVRSLAYFDGMVSDAIAARTRPLPAGTRRATGVKRQERPGEYSAPPVPNEEMKLNRLRGYAAFIKRRQNPGSGCSQLDLREMLRLELITADDLYHMGLAA